jgi:hypothetical protein
MQRVTTNDKTGKSRERNSHVCSVLCSEVSKLSLCTAVIAVAVLVLKFIKITIIIIVVT